MSPSDPQPLFSILPQDFELEDRAPLGSLGVLMLGTDFTLERELPGLLPKGLVAFTNRVLNANPLTLENLRTMAEDVTRAASGIMPGRGVDAMIYACTSGSVAIGVERITTLIRQAWPGIPVTTPLSAAKAAIDTLGGKRISILTPYPDEINHALADWFSDQGFEVLNVTGFGMDDDIDVAMVPTDALIRAAEISCDSQADLLFISCTALRAAEVVEELEARLNKPVLTSNQVLAWHALQLMNITARPKRKDRIFTHKS
ncbi:aspartate/glutamate racemase family protein [Kiloniella laminariae]|uniref:Aspartate/glutamate racemase family protein n=1 Tax=Kiloniella laminariae TaxID=454162 RepID=A0ABT4LET4_9PROT|nr:aspartate/glutamate racemase family protein [Kiloniella laminariae]MCZ4279605.1 aspartate/glutamate racemase family protein [Kiloniella laminariae]